MTTLPDLRRFDLIYVGTPYSKYPAGIEAAFRDACKLTARLLQEGLKVYSPIAHTHPIAIHGGIDPFDYAVWLPFDGAIMAKSDAMLIAKMEGWDASKGIDHEIEQFELARKHIYAIDPVTLEVARYERYRR